MRRGRKVLQNKWRRSGWPSCDCGDANVERVPSPRGFNTFHKISTPSHLMSSLYRLCPPHPSYFLAARPDVPNSVLVIFTSEPISSYAYTSTLSPLTDIRINVGMDSLRKREPWSTIHTKEGRKCT